MEKAYFLQGILLGFSIAAPVGPIGILCIRRTLAEGRTTGLASGLGAATADAFYGAVAGFGLTFISGFLISQRTWLSLIGGGFLCYLGVRTFLSRPAEIADTGGDRGPVSAYITTMLLTLTNPVTILSFAAVFAGLGLAEAAGDYASAALLVGGVFAGSALWWLLLSGGVGLFRSRFTARMLLWINRLSGAILIGFGLFALLRLF